MLGESRSREINMNDPVRKKSPRAPSIALDEAVERAIKIYDKERRHAAPTDVVAQDLGYKSANNGSALTAIASLRAFGLLEKAQEGKLAISKDVEVYRFAPDDALKDALRVKWARTPGTFADLLDAYASGLPSDATIRFDLIQRGFTPSGAESTLQVFKRSVEFANYFAVLNRSVATEDLTSANDVESNINMQSTDSAQEVVDIPAGVPISTSTSTNFDRIPVRLTQGRRAWLEIPAPFFESDKRRLIAQINLLLTDDESSSNDAH